MIQNLLTIFFIVAGVGLLWLNLRVWYRHKVIITPDEHEGLPAARVVTACNSGTQINQTPEEAQIGFAAPLRPHTPKCNRAPGSKAREQPERLLHTRERVELERRNPRMV